MHIHVIACRVFCRELSYYAALSPHHVTVSWLPQGLHNTPKILHEKLMHEISKVEQDETLFFSPPDAIALAYGLCSNGILGLSAEKTPLVIPRCDDCIALFLGSQERYLDMFNTYPGTYWLTSGWIETAFIPCEEMRAKQRQKYIERYGQDNADYLVEMDNAWIANYHFCGYIQSQVYEHPDYPLLASRTAQENNWEFFRTEGDPGLISALVSGSWDEERFLVCPPKSVVCPTYDSRKIHAVESEV